MNKKDLSIALLIPIMLLLQHQAYAQNIFHGILLNKADSSVIPYAAVTLRESGYSVVTNIDGSFQFQLGKNVKELTLDVEAIGAKASATYTRPFRKTEKIYIDVSANTLQSVAVKGLSALQVVRKAVAAIPDNYADTSYFNVSFYRRYQKVNDKYTNLFEACPVIMFKVKKDGKELRASEAYAVAHLRRSAFHPDIMNEYEDNPADLLLLNPVYHLDESSLRVNNFPNYYFSFDTTNKSHTDYVIHYFCNNYSTDHHGIGGYSAELFGMIYRGEEYETGTLVIDRETFAIKKFERKSIRHKDYEYKYRNPNNLVRYDNRAYFFEYVGGDLQAEYVQHNGKWYLDRMSRQYTSNFEDYAYNRLYTITDNFEWQSGAVSDRITGKYAHSFYPKMATAIHAYDTTFWQGDTVPFFYTTQEEVYNDLQRDGPLEQQFTDETKIDGYNERKKK